MQYKKNHGPDDISAPSSAARIFRVCACADCDSSLAGLEPITRENSVTLDCIPVYEDDTTRRVNAIFDGLALKDI